MSRTADAALAVSWMSPSRSAGTRIAHSSFAGPVAVRIESRLLPASTIGAVVRYSAARAQSDRIVGRQVDRPASQVEPDRRVARERPGTVERLAWTDEVAVRHRAEPDGRRSQDRAADAADRQGDDGRANHRCARPADQDREADADEDERPQPPYLDEPARVQAAGAHDEGDRPEWNEQEAPEEQPASHAHGPFTVQLSSCRCRAPPRARRQATASRGN